MKIELTSKIPNAQIRYTMDGTAPTEGSALYNEPFEIAGYPFTVRARTYADGLTPSRYSELSGKSPEEWTREKGSILNAFDNPINSAKVVRENIIVSVCSDAIYYSDNGFNWNKANCSYSRPKKIFYACGRYVVFGNNEIYSSADGINWEKCNVAFSDEINALLNGGAKPYYEYNTGNDARAFMSGYISSSNFFVVTSTDGVNWVGIDVPTRASALGYAKNKLFLFGNDRILYKSNDNGATFSQVDLGFSMSSTPKFNVVEENLYMIYSSTLYYSQDGEAWTRGDRYNSVYSDVKYFNNKFYVAMGYHVGVSENGIDWEIIRNVSTNSSSSILEFINGVLLFGDINGDMFTSTDGVTWVKMEKPSSFRQRTVFTNFAGKLFYSNGYGAVYTTNGIDWVSVPNNLDGIDYVHRIATSKIGTVLDGGSYGRYYSADGVTWTKIEAITGNGMGVAYGNGRFVVGGAGKAYTSTDGVNWTSHDIGTTAETQDVSFCNNMFIATGKTGLLATSADGEAWTVCNIDITQTIYKVCYANGLYVAGAESGYILTSTDGVNWTSHSISTSTFYGVIYAKDQFVAFGSYIYTSADGETWAQMSNTQNTRDMIYINGIFFCVYAYGSAIYYGTDITNMRGWVSIKWQKDIYSDYLRSIASDGEKIYVGGSHATLLKCELFKRSIEED